MLIRTNELTNGERLLIQRRRDGLTQGAIAKEYSVSLYIYRKWESGELRGAPVISIGSLSEAEQCFLMRKRAGLSLGEAAEKFGVCRWWLSQMEKGEISASRLRAYWAA